jgi:hypothetical protein
VCELVGGDKVLLPLNGEYVLSLTYLPTKDNSPFGECEFYSHCFQHLQHFFFFFSFSFFPFSPVTLDFYFR